jgi:transcriptional antiterminator
MCATIGGTSVSTIVWQRSGLSWDQICRRAGARNRWNSLRTFLANERRRQVLELLLALGGLERGAQSRLAEALGVHRSTISKDLKRLMPLATPCTGCGVLRPRDWWREEV